MIGKKDDLARFKIVKLKERYKECIGDTALPSALFEVRGGRFSI